MEFNIVEKLLSITLLGSAWVLWLLVILSIVSVAIMMERLLFFARIRIDYAAFVRDLQQALIDRNFEAASKLCAQSPAIESQVVLRGLEYRSRGTKAMEESMIGFLIGERQNLDRGIIVLGTLGNNAPFIGLFGTVLGIIIAFHELARNPAGGPSVVMSGISEALVATAVGLIVAIPAVVAYNYFQRVIKGHYANAEAALKMTVSLCHEE